MERIINFMQLDDRLATAGQPDREDFQNISAAGYQVVVNLAMLESPDAIPDEGDLVSSLGMKYIHIPVVWENPQLDDLNSFFSVMREHQEERVFVHCVLNMRVSAFLFLYRVICLGWSVEEARTDLLKIWEPEQTWANFISRALTDPSLRTNFAAKKEAE